LDVVYDDGSKNTVKLLKIEEPQEIKIDVRKTKAIKFFIRKIYQNEVNMGFSFHIEALKCNDLGGSEPIPEDEPIIMGCGESLYNHPLLSTQKLNIDQKFLIECVEGCMKDKNKVYGKDKYADVSYICASGLHAGVI